MLSILLSSAFAARHAVLFGGSNNWYNYRHQADCYTIYQQLLARGWKKEQITLMANDDLALHRSNPFQGKIWHKLDHKDNVYPGSAAISYKGNTVSAANFYSVLANLPTTSSDYVYIFYDNHGGPGILGVPDGCGGHITTAGLKDALNKMYANGKYTQALFGIEACYAGSVAEGFNAPKLATITASNAKESSYAAVYDSTIGTYLTNEFTAYWIDFCDFTPTGTVGQLFEKVKSQTKGSHVMYYGDESIKNTPLSQFLGTPNKVIEPTTRVMDIVPHHVATETAFEHLMYRHNDIKFRAKARLEYQALKHNHERLVTVLEEIAKVADFENFQTHLKATTGPITDTYFEVLEHFTNKFGNVNPDDLVRMTVFVSLCRHLPKYQVIKAINEVL
jgi:legumain